MDFYHVSAIIWCRISLFLGKNFGREAATFWVCQTTQLSSVALSCLTVCDPMDGRTPGFPSFTISRSLLRLKSIRSVITSNQLILCHPLLLLYLIFPSIGIFSSESVLHIKWPNYWSFSFSISHSNAYSGLISFRIDWFALLTVQGTLRRLLQNHSSKA